MTACTYAHVGFKNKHSHSLCSSLETSNQNRLQLLFESTQMKQFHSLCSSLETSNQNRLQLLFVCTQVKHFHSLCSSLETSNQNRLQLLFESTQVKGGFRPVLHNTKPLTTQTNHNMVCVHSGKKEVLDQSAQYHAPYDPNKSQHGFCALR